MQLNRGAPRGVRLVAGDSMDSSPRRDSRRFGTHASPGCSLSRFNRTLLGLFPRVIQVYDGGLRG